MRGISVALCGPDGIGKSTIATALEASLPGETMQLHHKPEFLPYPSPSPDRDFTQPYELGRRSRAMSLAKVLYLFVDWWLAWLFVISPRMRAGNSVVIQRPWEDMAVDPRRYRLDVPTWLLTLLGRMLPKPSLTLLLSAPAEVIASRKSELTIEQLDANAKRWREAIESVPRARMVDVSADLESTIVAILEIIDNEVPAKGHISLQDGRWILPRKPRDVAVAGISLYHPVSRRARIISAIARQAARLGLTRLWPASSPPPTLRAAVRRWLPPGGTFAARRLRGGQRWFVLALDEDGTPALALKLGLSPTDQADIESEKEAIQRLAPLVPPPLATPVLLDSPRGTLAMEPVGWVARDNVVDLPPPVAESLGALFASTGDETKGRVHGDLAPWNLLWDGDRWVLVDWEASTENGRPFHDIFHWMVQGHSLLGRPTAEEIINGLISGDGVVGRAIDAYARSSGFEWSTALAEFGVYLKESEPSDDPSGRQLNRARFRRRRLARLWSGADAPIAR